MGECRGLCWNILSAKDSKFVPISVAEKTVNCIAAQVNQIYLGSTPDNTTQNVAQSAVLNVS